MKSLKSAVILALLCAAHAFASTHIVDTIYLSDGVTVAPCAKLYIVGSKRDANGKTATTGSTTQTTDAHGGVDFHLEGGDGVTFRTTVTVYSNTSCTTVKNAYEEAWSVPDTGSVLTLRDIRSDAPASTATAGNYTITGYWNFAGGAFRFPEKTVSTLPSAAASFGKVYLVTNGATAADCTAGAGSTAVLCRSNGIAWLPVAGAAAATSPLTYDSSTHTVACPTCEVYSTVTTLPTAAAATVGRIYRWTRASADGACPVSGAAGGSGGAYAALCLTTDGVKWTSIGVADPYVCDATSSDGGRSFTCSANPPLGGYGTGGISIAFRSSTANLSGAVTLDVDGLGAKTITQGDGSSALVAAQLGTGGAANALYYDGSVFRVLSGPDISFTSVTTVAGCPYFPRSAIFNTDISQAPVDLYGTQHYLGMHHKTTGGSWSGGVASLVLDGVAGLAAGMKVVIIGVNGGSIRLTTGYNTGIGSSNSTFADPRVTLLSVNSGTNTITYALTSDPGTYVSAGTVSTGAYGGTRWGQTPEFVLNVDNSTDPGWLAYQLSWRPFEVSQCTGAGAPNSCCTGVGVGATCSYTPGNSFAITNLTGADNFPYPLKPTYWIDGFNGDGTVPTVATNAGHYYPVSDAHVLTLDTATCKLYEVYGLFGAGSGQDNVTGPPYYALTGSVWDLRSSDMRTKRLTTNDTNGLTSADAAGLPVLPLSPSWSEISSATLANPIRRSVRFTLPNIQDTWVWPGTHFASHNAQFYLPPMGSLWRLRSDFDTTTCHTQDRSGQSYPEWMQAWLWTLQHHGQFLADNGLPFLTVGADMTTEENETFSEWMHCIYGSDFEVVNTTALQRSTTSFDVQPFTAVASPLLTATTITSSPSALTLSVDGQNCTAPCTFFFAKNSTHTIAAVNQGTGTQYQFASWSDAGSASHTITASAAATYTATFTTAYLLTTSSTSGGSISPASGYYASGTVVSVSATADPGIPFLGFSGDLSGTSTPQNVTMSAPRTVAARFYDLTQWTHYKVITIDHTKVSGDQTDFPVLISTAADADISANARSDGNDIILTATDGTLLGCSKESYATGSFVGWSKISALSASVDNLLRIYYGNPGLTTSLCDPTSVWPAAYKAVYHLSDGTTLSLADSTSNALNATNHSATATTGQIDGAMAMASASSQYAEAPSTGISLTSTAVSVSAWVYFTSSANVPRFLDLQDATYSLQLLWDTGVNNALTTKHLQVQTGTNSLKWNFTPSITTWYKIDYVVDSNAGTQALYVNGVAKTSSAGTTVGDGSNRSKLQFGRRGDGNASTFLNGRLDEVRIYQGSLTAGWILTGYNNQSSPSTFYALGAQQ